MNMQPLEPVIRGDDWLFEVFLTGDDGLPVSVENTTLTMTLKKSAHQQDFDSILQITTSYQQGDDIGRIALNASSNETVGIDAGVYVYDIQAEENGSVLTLVIGDIRVIADITRGKYGV